MILAPATYILRVALSGDVVRWVTRAANQMQFDAVLSATGARPIVDISARGGRWSAWPAENGYEGFVREIASGQLQ